MANKKKSTNGKKKNAHKKSNQSSPKEQRKWQSIRYRRYQETVWKGWRLTDGVTYPVTGSGGKKKTQEQG